ncbi:MAG: NAD-dependent epimerase/dehydratase family protein [Deltaproteobacteria bacterium]|nr:NAD-dependent epimerase/dehydratase family protein [Deltaproteobacteria bacterium]
MKILVTGAAGYIGGRLIQALCEQTWVESIIGTDIREPSRLCGKYRFDRRDVRESMDDLFDAEGINTVVHTAYVLPPIHDKGKMEAINKGGTLNVLESAARAGVNQVLYTSSTTAYGFYPDNDTPLTEESPLRGNNDFTYAKNKKEIEKIIADFADDHPEMAISVVRPCFVVGPGFDNPLARHLKKKFVLLPKKTLPWQFVHEEDLVNVMLLLLEKRINGVYNVCAPGTMTFGEMIRMLGNIMVPVPWRILYPLNNLAWFLRLSFITAFPSPSMRMMINPWIASSEKLVKNTGYEFKHTSRKAFADFVRSV